MPFSAAVSLGLAVLNSKETKRTRAIILKAIKASHKDISDIKKILKKPGLSKKRHGWITKLSLSYTNFLKEIERIIASHISKLTKNRANILLGVAEITKEIRRYKSGKNLSKSTFKKVLRLYTKTANDLHEYNLFYKKLTTYKQDLAKVLVPLSKPQRSFNRLEKSTNKVVHSIKRILKKWDTKGYKT